MSRVVGDEEVRRAVEVVTAAAVNGERCPNFLELRRYGVWKDALPCAAREGKIRIEVCARNYRTVWICTGPHAGEHTALPPKHYTAAPYMVIGPERPA